VRGCGGCGCGGRVIIGWGGFETGTFELSDSPVANVVSPSMGRALNRNDVTIPKLPLTRVGEFTTHPDGVKVLALNAAANRCSKFA
jgi:hypothetical protein